MMPVQKVVNIYKSSMDLKDKSGSHTLYKDMSSSGAAKGSYSDKDKNSFQSILKKTMSK